MNNNYENDELKPFVEPKPDFSDQRRIEILTQMGYSRDEIEDSLRQRKYDDVMANYLLLGKRTTEVIDWCLLIFVIDNWKLSILTSERSMRFPIGLKSLVAAERRFQYDQQ